MFKWIVATCKRKFQLFSLVAMVWLAVACRSSAGSTTPTPLIVDPGPAECDQRVLVVVWGDLDGNGVQDSDEPPLADVLLMITTKDDPTSDGIQLSTNEDGKAHFPTRELENCQTADYQVLFLRQVAGYAFPAQPVISLDDFDPLDDAVYFGLLPEEE